MKPHVFLFLAVALFILLLLGAFAQSYHDAKMAPFEHSTEHLDCGTPDTNTDRVQLICDDSAAAAR